MRWIKATERLPEGKERYFARIKTYLERENTVDCILTHAHNPEWYYAIGHELRLSIHAEKIVEWIDVDEQDEGWVPVEVPPPTNEKYNESDYCLCLHESGEQVVCWYNSKEKAWRVGNYKADSLPLTGITHYRKLPAPPATKD